MAEVMQKKRHQSVPFFHSCLRQAKSLFLITFFTDEVSRTETGQQNNAAAQRGVLVAGFTVAGKTGGEDTTVTTAGVFFSSTALEQSTLCE